jgi:ADP-dependent NAD(P)H-hydrate dehydratase / NAD(P)H-hydrate epimerase
MRILNSAQMREADRRATGEIGIASIVLMENAGRQVVAAMESVFPDLSSRRVIVLCGRGSNGGDGFVIARTLAQRGVDVSVFLIGGTDEVKGDARANLDVLVRLGHTLIEIRDASVWELQFPDIRGGDLLVDALFGTGLRTPLTGLYETIVADINASDLPVVSVDLPSGLSADTSDVIGPCIDASLTVTLGSPKLPLVLPPGEAHCGDVVIADIGIPDAATDGVDGPHMELLTREPMRALVEPRPADSHKGDYGHVLVIAGAPGKTGAAHLAAMGALKSGSGLVTIASPQSCQPILAAMAPEYMTLALEAGPDGINPDALDQVLALPADVIAAGPGLGTGSATAAFVRGLLVRTGVPLVLDADALNIFASMPEQLVGAEGRDVIITPHPGELARLMGVTTADVQANRIELAQNFAESHQLYVVLKGHRSIIATPEGHVYVNPTGNPGMATGGMGDVLTGMIAGWLGQLLDADAACRLAVYLHGMAGDLAESAEGEVSLLPGDVLAHLGDAVLELTARRKVERRPA